MHYSRSCNVSSFHFVLWIVIVVIDVQNFAYVEEIRIKKSVSMLGGI